MQILTFDQVAAQFDSCIKPSVLLGNGFSMAWDPTIFAYSQLLDHADFGSSRCRLRSLFSIFNTYNFEIIMQHLRTAWTVLETYGGEECALKEIETDQKALKESLLTAISKTHPNLPHEVNESQYKAVRRFLNFFNQIYSLNFDLLLYWARLVALESSDYIGCDGFGGDGGSTWGTNKADQNIHFIHGGLHLYEDSDGVKKLVHKNGGKLVDQVRTKLDEGRFPIFVAEPTFLLKKQRIEHNPYLNYCFQSLQKCSHTLVVYGHSFADNDRHIYQELKKSSVRQIFVSLFGPWDSEANRKIILEAISIFKGRKINFFRAESAPVWSEHGPNDIPW